MVSPAVAAADLEYERCTNAISILQKDEEQRKLRMHLLILREEVADLNEAVCEEAEYAQQAQVDRDNWQARSEEMVVQLEQVTQNLRSKNREVDTLKAELSSLQNVSADSSRLLVEKLALEREISVLKPELDHLRWQDNSNKNILTEKLALEQELKNMEVMLEAERVSVQNYATKQRTGSEREMELETEIEGLKKQLSKAHKDLTRIEKSLSKSTEKAEKFGELKRELAKEKREREKAEQKAEKAEEVDALKQELARERLKHEKALKDADNSAQVIALEEQLAKAEQQRVTAERNAKKAEKNAEEVKKNAEISTQLEELRIELAEERKKRENAEKAAAEVEKTVSNTQEIDELREELAKEQKRRSKNDKQTEKMTAEAAAEKALLEEKLNQFRVKLKSTKEKLKETERDLQQARAAVTVLHNTTGVQSKNPRKRGITQIDPDAAIGTPGDGDALKRRKRESSVIGEKSTFSVTPFLKRIASVPPEGVVDHANRDGEIQLVPSIETEDSPSADRSETAPTSRNPLAPASGGTSNARARPISRKKAAAPSALSQVAEEGESHDENAPPACLAEAEERKEKPLHARQLKPKSLSSFASFREASLPPVLQVREKKQKFLGGTSKTIFDDDEEGNEVAFEMARPGLGGQRAFGTLTTRGFGGFGLAGKKKGPLLVAKDGFAFSPLKKERKAAAAAATLTAVAT